MDTVPLANSDFEDTATPRLPTARRGILVVLSYIGLQFLFSLLIAFVVGAIMGISAGKHQDPDAIRALLNSWRAVIGIASTMGAAAVILGWLYRKIRNERDSFSYAFLGLRRVSRAKLGWALGAGALTTVAYLSVVLTVIPDQNVSKLGPLATLSISTDWHFAVWVGIALLAPFIEEILFRGVLLRSCLVSWPRLPGSAVAIIVTVAAFVALHLGEIIPVPSAAIGITGLGIVATWFALKRSTTESIAVHLGYNATIVLVMVAQRLSV